MRPFDKQTKVAMVGKFFPPVRGGLEEYVHGLAEAVADACDLTVIVHAQGRRTRTVDNRRYRVVECGTWLTIASQPISPALLWKLRSQRFDIVHLHVPNVLGILAVMLSARGAKLVITHHADMVGFGPAGAVAIWLYRRLVKRAAAITVLSLKNRDLARDIGPTDVPFFALPVGLPPARFDASPQTLREAQRLRATRPSTDLVLGFIGRLVPYKGMDVLIEALALTSDVSCLVAGEGREKSTLIELARSKGVADRIIFLGDISAEEKLALLYAVDVFVLPSVTCAEAFGIVQVEAQFCGLPVITTDLPSGVTDVTRDGQTGLIVPPRDARALASAIEQLQSDPELARRLGAAGRARALSEYTDTALSVRATALYRTVVGSPKA
jgi:glycosyltransferase involved in cell wall biosynthesis